MVNLTQIPSLLPIALQVALSASRDCLIAGDICSSDETCSPRLRTLRQCVAGNGSMKLGPGARSQCANAVSALLSSPLHGCQCRRGMKREKNCLSIYWSLHQIHMLCAVIGQCWGLNLVENYPYEAIEKGYDFVRLASITAAVPWKLVRDSQQHKLRTEYVSTCIKPSTKSGLCNRSRCNKALRRFFDRVPPEYTHELLFCPCSDMACSERRRQTIVPSCSYEGEDKPSCLSQMRICKADYVCRSRLAQFQYDCQPEEQSATGCKQGNYAACLIAYTGLIGSPITPNYVDNSTSNVSPWCSCSASGNLRDQCTEFLDYFTNNVCLRNALLTFGNGMDFTPTPTRLQRLSPVTDRGPRPTTVFVTMETEQNALSPAKPTQDSAKVRLWSDSTASFDTQQNSARAFAAASLLVWICMFLSFLLRCDQ
ncbi:GDNF family receptor alpha-4 [Labeo rohita]|uniref:GDNF family receptor alpha-4 n=1 Tax=Labeo rohita TaxID=84645 RepID=A0ABQ8M1B9_LABRO|nr:GDNF family receptor alpha-4 [Labeo rohita]